MESADTIVLKVETLMRYASQTTSADPQNNMYEFVLANTDRIAQRAELPHAEGFWQVRLPS